jgi:hypothetical protein
MREGIDFVRQPQEFIGLQLNFFDFGQIDDLAVIWPECWIQLQAFRVSLNVVNRQLFSELYRNQPLFGVDGVLGRPAQRLHIPLTGKRALIQNILVRQRRTSGESCTDLLLISAGWPETSLLRSPVDCYVNRPVG